jgi:ABC-2 type transport system ATP-binding protein
MVATLLRPDAGELTVCGASLPDEAGDARRRIGYLGHDPLVYQDLTARQNLELYADLYGLDDPRDRVDAALDRVGLLAAATKRYRAYSLGMRQRLAIAAPLLMPRRLLILDEPTNGLDPQGTREVRTLIGSLNAEGTTVLVSSHLLSEVEQVCTHVGVMNAGSLVAQGTVAQVRIGGAQRARVQTPRAAEAARVLSELGLTEVAADAGTASGAVGDVPAESIVPALVRAGIPVLGFAIDRPSLEELFVSLTGEGFDVNG